MNKFIKTQIDKIKVADVPDYKEEDGKIIFKRKSLQTSTGLIQGTSYRVELKDYIIHPYEGFTLHTNWNNDIIPTDNEMNIEVTQLMGKMVKFRGVGIHDGKFWTGWVPISAITIIAVL